MRTFHDVWTFCFETKCFVPKVPQKCLGGVWDHPRPIPDHSGPILTKNRLTTEITKSYKKSYNKTYNQIKNILELHLVNPAITPNPGKR